MNIDTKYGPMLTNAEYVYGDSVANYTPVYIKMNGYINILSIEDVGNKCGETNWKQCVEPGNKPKNTSIFQTVRFIHGVTKDGRN